ncbi:MAG: transporter small permease subunit [Enterovirga sp.]|jgi:TRAP-type C4-dicarboxylate transport system permease small subunit|nr:transporter small permease subunit [Enterovirga sp.]
MPTEPHDTAFPRGETRLDRPEDPALSRGVRTVEAAIHRLTEGMAYLSGAAFLILSFYMTWDVLGRKFGFPYSGVTDDVSGYTLAIAGTWAMAHALRTGGHVRIDVLMPFFSPRVREVLAAWGLAMATVFTGMLTYYSWGLAQESFDMDARGISMLQAPLAVPQALVAIGFTILTVQAVLLLVLALTNVVPKQDAAPTPATYDV